MADRFPWFPFYAADWLASPRVRALKYEQRGMFLELLCLAWNAGRDEPTLSADPGELADILGLSRARWAKLGPGVVKCFEVRDGRLHNKKLTEVWEVQRAKYELAAKAGRASGESRRRTPVQRTFNGRSTDVGTERERKSNGRGTEREDTDADTNRTKSSSGAVPLRALVGGALGPGGKRA